MEELNVNLKCSQVALPRRVALATTISAPAHASLVASTNSLMGSMADPIVLVRFLNKVASVKGP